MFHLFTIFKEMFFLCVEKTVKNQQILPHNEIEKEVRHTKASVSSGSLVEPVVSFM